MTPVIHVPGARRCGELCGGRAEEPRCTPALSGDLRGFQKGNRAGFFHLINGSIKAAIGKIARLARLVVRRAGCWFPPKSRPDLGAGLELRAEPGKS